MAAASENVIVARMVHILTLLAAGFGVLVIVLCALANPDLLAYVADRAAPPNRHLGGPTLHSWSGSHGTLRCSVADTQPTRRAA